MKEFLIRRKDDEFCIIHVSQFDKVLHPKSFDSKRIDGWGDYRLQIENCEISFSFEMVGIQICFEDCEISDERAQLIINEICHNVEAEIASSCYSIQISS